MTADRLPSPGFISGVRYVRCFIKSVLFSEKLVRALLEKLVVILTSVGLMSACLVIQLGLPVTLLITVDSSARRTRDRHTSLLGSRGRWDHAYSETGSGEFAYELAALQRLESRPSELRVLLRRRSAVQGKKESAGGE